MARSVEVHTDAMAVASVAQALHAEASYCGAIGTRSCDYDQPIRTMPSTSTPLVYVDEAGPCGEGLSRSRKARSRLLGCRPLADPAQRSSWMLGSAAPPLSEKGGHAFFGPLQKQGCKEERVPSMRLDNSAHPRSWHPTRAMGDDPSAGGRRSGLPQGGHLPRGTRRRVKDPPWPPVRSLTPVNASLRLALRGGVFPKSSLNLRQLAPA